MLIMIGSVAVTAGLGAVPHALELAWSLAVAAGALYALVMLVRGVSARHAPASRRGPRGVGDTDRTVTQVPNLVNTTPEPPFTHVGASTRWPGVWIGQPVCPPAAAPPAVPAARGQRRRLSLRSVMSMTHQRGLK